MRCNRVPAVFAVTAVAVLALGGHAFTIDASTIGHTPVDGSADTCGGCGFVMLEDRVSASDAGLVTDYTFYSKISGTTLTPLIFDNALKVIGRGTTRTTATAAGVETFSFGLVEGSAAIGPANSFGWQPAGTDVSPVAFNTPAGHVTVALAGMDTPVDGLFNDTLRPGHRAQHAIRPHVLLVRRS